MGSCLSSQIKAESPRRLGNMALHNIVTSIQDFIPGSLDRFEERHGQCERRVISTSDPEDGGGDIAIHQPEELHLQQPQDGNEEFPP